MTDLRVKVGSLTLKNPIVAASGVFGYGLELLNFSPPEKLGAVISKGLSLTPWPGNPGPRVTEAAGGLINAIGLENMGIFAFLKKALPPLKARGAIVGANILGRTPKDYAQLAEILSDSEVDFLELNISCPNLSAGGGLSFGSDPLLAARLAEKAIKAAKKKPVWVKLPPMVSDLPKLTQNMEKAGAAAISLINTIPAMAIDLEKRRPKIATITGGLSGPPIKPVALRQVYLAAQSVKIPIVGLGGIFTAEDALEFMVAGATAVQLGTVILTDPYAPIKIIRDMEKYLKSKKIQKVDNFTKSLSTT